MATEKRSLSIEAKVTDLATAQFTKMLGSARGFAGAAIPLFKATAVAFGAISAAATGAFVVFQRYAENLDKIAKASDKFGLTAEGLTAIRDGAEQAGVGIDELATSMKAFEAAVAAANDGGKQQRETFAQLGLSAEEFSGSQLDLVDVLSKVAGGLEGVGSASEKTAILVKLFGKSGADLAPLLKAGSDGIQRMAAEAKAAGAVFSREELQKVEDFNDSWTKLQQTFRTLAERLVVDLSPAFAELFNNLSELVRNNSATIRKEILDILDVLVVAFEVMQKGASVLALFGNGLKAAAHAAGAGAAALGGAGDAADRLVGKLGEDKETITEWWKSLTTSSSAADAMRAAIERLRGSAAKKAPTVLVEAPKFIGDIEDNQAQVLPNAWDKFLEGAAKARAQWTDFTQAAMDSGQRLVGGTLDSLTGAIATGLEGTKSWGRAWKDWGQQVRGIIAQVIARLVVMRAVSGATQLFGGGGPAPTTSPSPSSTPSIQTFARGGIMLGGIASVFAREQPKATAVAFGRTAADYAPLLTSRVNLSGRPRGEFQSGFGLAAPYLRRFAMGGVVREPTLALMGEGSAPAEAFVPLPDGKSIPVTVRGSGSTAAPVVTNNVTHINFSFPSVDGHAAAEFIYANKSMIIQIVASAMQRSNGFRGVVQEAAG